jgi:hypothetical protein
VTQVRSGLPEGLVEFIHGVLIKRPDERLTDWSIIRRLLSGPASGADLRSQPREHDLISVQFGPSARRQVGAAVEGLLRQLKRIEGVEVSHGRMVGVSSGGISDKPETTPTG